MDQNDTENVPPRDALLLGLAQHLQAAGHSVEISGLHCDPPTGLDPAIDFRGPGAGGSIVAHPDSLEVWVRRIVTWVTSDGASHEEVRPYQWEFHYENPNLIDLVLRQCTQKGPE